MNERTKENKVIEQLIDLETQATPSLCAANK